MCIYFLQSLEKKTLVIIFGSYSTNFKTNKIAIKNIVAKSFTSHVAHGAGAYLRFS